MRPGARQLLAYAAVTAVLAGVAALYLGPHLMVDLAARVWACF
ncbi:MAG TPA: hypothetical protein VFQ20_02550 [Burkholderiaceae bacterium]|nr:hypothetical protein [Burkholderiaceae bacterium]